MFRPCGIKHTAKNNAYKLDELINFALEKGLITTKTEGRTKGLKWLCDKLDLPEKDKNVVENVVQKPILKRVEKLDKEILHEQCMKMTTKEITETYKQKFDELGLPSNLRDSMTKRELCNLLFPKEIPPFNKEECPNYTNERLLTFSHHYGVPIMEGLNRKDFPNGKQRSCDLLDKSINKKYNTVGDKEWSAIKELLCARSNNFELKEHQIRVARHMLNHRSLLAIHNVGTGKTITACAAASCVISKYPNIRVVIVTPAILRENFILNAERFGIPRERYEVYGFEEYLKFFESSNMPNCDNTFLIIDEVHNLRARLKFDGSGEITDGKIAYSVMKCASRAFKLLLLTATPFVNTFDDLHNLYVMLSCVEPTQGIPYKRFYDLKNDPVSFFRMFKCKVSYYYPMDNENYPKVIYHEPIKFEMKDNYLTEYLKVERKELDRDLLDKLASVGEEEKFYSKLRRATNALERENSPKINWIIDFLKEQKKSNRKSLIYSSWLGAGINYIRQRLDNLSDQDKISYILITGEVENRAEYVKLFNENKADVILVSSAGGEGLSLKEVRNVILVESSWNPTSEIQIIGRAVRMDSHNHLPEEERTVDVYRLWMVKPQMSAGKEKSADEILYNLSYDKKLKEQEETISLLSKVSIEENICICKPGEMDVGCPIDLYRPFAKKDKILDKAKVENPFIYVAKEGKSNLVKPDETSENVYKKLAGLKLNDKVVNPLQMLRQAQQPQQQLEVQQVQQVQQPQQQPQVQQNKQIALFDLNDFEDEEE